MISEQQMVTSREEDMNNENHVELTKEPLIPIEAIDNKEKLNGLVSFNITFRRM